MLYCFLKKNKRRCNLKIPNFLSIFIFYRTKIIRKKITFLSGCNYTLDGTNQLNVNKLFGFTFNTLPKIKPFTEPHHINSYRFGWRYLNNKIEIIPYEYINKKVSDFIPMFNIKMGETYLYEMIIRKNEIIYNIYNTEYTLLANHVSICKYKSVIGHYLGFYFGGSKKSPNDMYLLID